MNRPVTRVAVVIASLSVGYALGVRQPTSHAMARLSGERAGVVMPGAERAALLAMPGNEHIEHASAAAGAALLQAAPPNLKLPADEEGAKNRLSASPRHGEFVKVQAGNWGKVNTWVVYPQRQDKAPVVILIHEIFGLSDWIRVVADQFAAEGFIAVAPDLLSGHGPTGGGTEELASRDDVTRAVQKLPETEMNGRLRALRDWAIKLPAANGKSASVGFCFGGSRSFIFATIEPNLNAAVVYYGSTPAAAEQTTFAPAASLRNIKAPVLGLYGGADQRISATVPATEAKMKELGKTYEVHTFEGAGHGFLRAQTDQNGANMKASEQAWPMTIAFLKKNTEG